jgi:hypothetical protein
MKLPQFTSPPPFPSFRTPISRDTEYHKINELNGEENIEQSKLLTVKTDVVVGGRDEVSTIEDGSSGIGHSTRIGEDNSSGIGHSTRTGEDSSNGTSKTGHSTRTGEDSSGGTGKTGYSTRTGEDGSGGTGKTGNSTGTKRKHKTVTHKRQHGEFLWESTHLFVGSTCTCSYKLSLEVRLSFVDGTGTHRLCMLHKN